VSDGSLILVDRTQAIVLTGQIFLILAVLTVLAAPVLTNALFAVSGASIGVHPSLRLAPAGIGGP